MDYTSEIKLLTEHVTITRKLRASVLLKFLQEISIAHTIELGYPRAKTLDRGLLWVVARQSFEVKRMPEYDETITISTYPAQTMRFIFPRIYDIKDEKGETIITGVAMWAMINKDTRKVIVPGDFGIVIHDESNGRTYDMPSQIRFGELSGKTVVKAAFSDCDLNGHLNNTAYLDIAEDLLPLDFLKSHTLRHMAIDYKKEVPCGAEIPLSYGKDGDRYVFHSDFFTIELEYI